MSFVSLLVFSAIFGSLEGSKILGIVSMPAYSHFVLETKLLTELALRGHDVTVISAYKNKKDFRNYKEIIVGDTYQFLKTSQMEEEPNLFNFGSLPIVLAAVVSARMGANTAEKTVQHPKVQELLNSDQKFDLVIAGNFNNECVIGFAHRFDCPYILLSTLGSSSWVNGMVSNPAPFSYVPEILLELSNTMNFWERLLNTYFGLYNQALRNFYLLPKHDAILHTYFKNAPSLEELFDKRLAMILVNSHPVIIDARPHVPSMVEIGGFHIEEPKALPKDLQEFMDSAKDGVILFSMGSMLKSTQFPAEKRDAVLRTFAKLKQKVIWKWETDSLPGQSDNVKIHKWLPQNDILAHPNVRLFISHGGMLSTTEAIYHGVPIIGLPIFGDQRMNIAQAVRRNYALTVNYEELTEEKLTNAINEMLANPSYRDNIRKRSMILRDRPLKPIDAAVFWVEHVLRHKGAEHFKTSARHLHWSQLYLLDVIAFSAVIVFVTFATMICVCRKFSCSRKSRKNSKKSDDEKKKTH